MNRYNSKSAPCRQFMVCWFLLPVLLRTSRSQRGESRHEEVKSGEGNHVDRQLPQVSVELAGEPEAGGHTGHGQGDQMIQISVGWVGQLQSSRGR